MRLNKYQEIVFELAHKNTNPLLLAVQLGSEAGEVLGEFQKSDVDYMRGDKQFDRNAVAEELGDCLYNIAVMAQQLGYSLDEIAETNIKKCEAKDGK